ncbi:MAG: hypothetical protein IJ649_03775, partial [Oscillospiraceae bacterium]|nr:hypothetical protein [Oscillospiraceae bacterium]
MYKLTLTDVKVFCDFSVKKFFAGVFEPLFLSDSVSCGRERCLVCRTVFPRRDKKKPSGERASNCLEELSPEGGES